MRNCLKPGDYVIPEPFGIKMMLRYDSRGVIDHIEVGSDYANMVDMSNTYFSIMREHISDIPSKIAIKDGSTFVYGTLYTDTIPYLFDSNFGGLVPDIYIHEYMHNTNIHYTFYASYVKSNAISFTSPIVTRNWLAMSRFKTTPSFIAPANPSEQFYNYIVNSSQWCNLNKHLGGVTYYRDGQIHSQTFRYFQMCVKRVVTKISTDGAILGRIESTSIDESDSVYIDVNYSTILNHNIQSGDLVFQYDNMIGGFAFSVSKKINRQPRSTYVQCPVCKKQIDINKSGPTYCIDESCMSRHYYDFCNMITTLDLPQLSHDEFIKLAKSNQVLNIVDFLDLPPYSEYTFELNLPKLLRAVIPAISVRNISTIEKFVIRCKHDIDTIKYYVHNPNRIIIDLDMNDLDSKHLIEWFTSVYNQSTVEAMLSCDKVKLLHNVKEFDGSPIFRNKIICITGIFDHGTLDDIAKILRSYSANVVYNYSDDVNCILVGQSMERVQSDIIKQARANNIPILYESNFFEEYGINDDLKQYT